MTLKPSGISGWKLLRNDPASFADSAEEHLATTVETARERLRKGDPAGNFVVGMFEDGKLTGTAGFFRRPHNKENHKGHIWGVYVTTKSRGKGVASALMKEIIRQGRIPLSGSGANYSGRLCKPSCTTTLQSSGI